MILMNKNVKKISFREMVGGGYDEYLRFKGRYRICKGSRASKKSATTSLDYIKNMMKYPQANLLVVRKTGRTLKDSVYTQLKWAVHKLQVDAFWKFTESPLEMTYLPTGQKIYFRGLDDPLKVTSIAVDVGVLCWMWIEEAYEITKEDDFNILDESIRGSVPPGLWKQITLTFNPWNEKIWIKKRFYDAEPDEDILAITTNYMCNEFLDEADLRVFERMKRDNPKRYKVAGLGNWGIVDGLVYENWREEAFSLEEIKHCNTACGLDFGYTNDPTAFFMGFLDTTAKKLYVWDEMYEKGMSNKAIHKKIVDMGYSKERIIGDSAEPKSIDELKGLGLRIKGAKKGKDSVMNGIQWIQDLEIIIHPRCVNFLTEISNYTWDEDRFGNKINKPIDDFNHLMDAMRYALEGFIKRKGWFM
jgi:phage terminase large subunit|nr:MAG TPA: terminase large subunit [Caudoviricetes sp.]